MQSEKQIRATVERVIADRYGNGDFPVFNTPAVQVSVVDALMAIIDGVASDAHSRGCSREAA